VAAVTLAKKRKGLELTVKHMLIPGLLDRAFL